MTILLLLFLLRNFIFLGTAEALLTDFARRRLGPEVEVRLERLHGSWWREFGVQELIVSEGKSGRRLIYVEELSLAYSPSRILAVSVLAGMDALLIKDAIIYSPFPELIPQESLVEVEDLSAEELDPRETVATLLEVFPHRMLLDLELSLQDPNLGELHLRAQGTGEEGIRSRIELEGGELAYETQFILQSSPGSLSIRPERYDAVPEGFRTLSISGSLDTNPQTARINAYELALSLEGAELELIADREKVGLTAVISGTDLDGEVGRLNQLLPSRVPRLQPAGRLEFEATLEAPEDGGSASVAEALLQAPRALFEAFGAELLLEAKGVQAETMPTLDLEGRLLVAPPRWELHSFKLSSPEGLSLTAGGLFLRDSKELRRSVVDFAIADLSSFTPLANSLMPGEYPLAGTLEGSLSLDGELPRPDIGFRLEGEELKLADLSLGMLSLKGDYTARRLRLSRARIESSGEDSYAVDVVENTDISLSEEKVSLAETSLRVPGGRMSLEAEIGEESLFLEAEAENFKIDLLRDLFGSEFPIQGAVDWRASAMGSLEKPNFKLSLESRELLFRKLPLDLNLSLEQTGRGISLRRFNLNWDGRYRFNSEGALPLRLDSAGLGRAPLGDQELIIDTSGPDILRLFSRDREQPESSGAGFRFRSRLTEEQGLAEYSAELNLDNRMTEEANLEGQSVSRLDLNASLIERSGERIEAELKLRVDEDAVGSAAASLQLPGLSTGELDLQSNREGAVPRIEADARLRTGLGLFASFIPSVIYAEGLVEGEMSIEGPLVAPHMNGKLRIDHGGLRFTGSLPALTAIEALVSFDPEALRIESLRGEAGRAPFTISGGLNLQNSKGKRELGLKLQGDNLLLYSDPDMRIRSDTELEVGGTLQAPRISGRLRISEAEYTRDYPLLNLNTPPAPDAEALQLFSLSGEVAADSKLDISLRADESILIENNILIGRASLDLDLTGSLQVPVLTGRAFLNDASLRLPVTTVALNTLTVEFPRANPFQPRVRAQGQSRVGEYEIFLQVAGTMPGVEIELSTTPPLPQDQALLLLTAGITGERDLYGGERTIRPLGTFVGRRVVETIFGGSEAEEILVERVDVAIGGDFAENGVELIEVEFQLDREENWFIRFQRDRLDQNSVGLAWRLWFN